MEKMIERISFESQDAYSAYEGAVHIARYMTAKDFCRGRRILDAACGEGYGSSLLARWGAAEVVGLDIAADAVARAEKNFAKGNVRFFRQDIEQLAMFGDASFDMAVSLETIEHLPHPEIFLRELRRVLKPAGLLIMSCPNDHWYYPGEKDGNPYHLRKYTMAEFKRMVDGIFGECARMCIGTPAAGFVNIAREDLEKPAADGQLAMLEYQDGFAAVRLPADCRLSAENCAYFIGIWGGSGREFCGNAVIYPNSMDWFEEYKIRTDDTIRGLNLRVEELWWENERLKSENKVLLDGQSDQAAYLAENRRGVQAENEFLRENSRAFLLQLEKLQAVQRDKQFRWDEEKERLQAEKEWLRTELDGIAASRGYRLLQGYYRWRDLVKKALGK